MMMYLPAAFAVWHLHDDVSPSRATFAAAYCQSWFEREILPIPLLPVHLALLQ